MKIVATVVVTYNRKDLLIENIKSLMQQTKADEQDIIIIDNNSTDGTYDALQQYIANNDIIYCNTGANLGGAGGFNYGMRYAVEAGYSFVWVMDDDCMPTKNCLETFMEYEKENSKTYGFLCSKVLWQDFSICTMNIPRRTMYQDNKDFKNKAVQVCMASFVSFFVPARIIKEVGLPIKEFFIWTDDWEFSRRISLIYPCYLLNESIAIHKSKSNIGAKIATESMARLERFFYLYRNDVYLYRREGLQGFIYEVIRLAYHAVKILLQSDHKMDRLGKIFQGTLAGLSFDPKIEKIQEKI